MHLLYAGSDIVPRITTRGMIDFIQSIKQVQERVLQGNQHHEDHSLYSMYMSQELMERARALEGLANVGSGQWE